MIVTSSSFFFFLLLFLLLFTSSLAQSSIRHRTTRRRGPHDNNETIKYNYIYEHDININTRDNIIHSYVGICPHYRIQESVHSFINNITLYNKINKKKYYLFIKETICNNMININELNDYICDSEPLRDVVGALLWSDDAYVKNGIQRHLIYKGYDSVTTTNCICCHPSMKCYIKNIWNDVKHKVEKEMEIYESIQLKRKHPLMQDNPLISNVHLQTLPDSSSVEEMLSGDDVVYNHSVGDRRLYDVTISLGYNCESAIRSKMFGLRHSKAEGYQTCPFDVLLSNYEGLLLCLDEDFLHLTDTRYLEVMNVPHDDPLYNMTTDRVIYNTRYNFVFLHESPIQYQYEKDQWEHGINHFVTNDYENLKERYNRRVDNFRNYMNGSYSVLFVLLTPDRAYNSGLPRLNKVLQTNYPNVSYRFSKFNHQDRVEQFIIHYETWMGLNVDEVIY